jgi:hypothetical protein
MMGCRGCRGARKAQEETITDGESSTVAGSTPRLRAETGLSATCPCSAPAIRETWDPVLGVWMRVVETYGTRSTRS